MKLSDFAAAFRGRVKGGRRFVQYLSRTFRRVWLPSAGPSDANPMREGIETSVRRQNRLTTSALANRARVAWRPEHAARADTRFALVPPELLATCVRRDLVH